MAYEIDFHGDEADQWIRDLEELNEQTDDLLLRISNNLDQVQNSGSGQIVDNLVKVASGLTIGFRLLMDASSSLAEKFGGILREIKTKVTQVTTDIDTSAKNMYGGGSKSIRDTQIYQ